MNILFRHICRIKFYGRSIFAGTQKEMVDSMVFRQDEILKQLKKLKPIKSPCSGEISFKMLSQSNIIFHLI